MGKPGRSAVSGSALSKGGNSAASAFGALVEQLATSRGEAIEAIREGLPASAVKDASEYLGMSLSKTRALLRLPESKAGRPARAATGLDANVSERLWRLANIVQLATEVFEDEAAAKVWLKSPNRAFNNASPLDYLDTEPGAMSVRQVLNAIATGGAA